MKGVRFWGTRGSLPVALTARDVREKLLGALRAARGRELGSDSDQEAILDGLPFAAVVKAGDSKEIRVSLTDWLNGKGPGAAKKK